MALSKSARYYRSNPEAREKKKKYDTELNAKPAQRKKRSALNKYNRKKKDPKGNKTDAYHKGKKIAGYKPQSANRGDTNDSAGDRRSRGGKKA